jgi:DNA-binding CsgD family transcriptional regulator
MDVHALGPDRSHLDPISREAPQLISALGSDHFVRRLAAIIRQVIGCNIINACHIDPKQRQRVIYAAGNGDVSCERIQDYAVRYWDADPGNAVMRSGALVSQGALVHLREPDMRSISYRRRLYSAAAWEHVGGRLVERVTLLRKLDSGIYRLAFYRDREAGAFQAEQLRLLGGAADLLFALAEKHETPISASLGAGERLQHYISRLQRVAPNLSPREVEVCSGIAAGLSSEGIALALGIRLNTVLSHRRNAYSKLEVSSQNQLMTRMYV